MCGIVGYIGKRIADRVLIDGLKKLEYRGYDSSGISILENNKILTFKKIGKIINLESDLSEKNLTARIGIAHTRWATHGIASQKNAHPHNSQYGYVSIVHNGIIENYLELKKILPKNYTFVSDTDSEVIAHLIEYFYLEAKKNDESNLYILAIQKTINLLKGNYAINVIFNDNQNEIFATKHLAPMIIGIGDDEMFFSSDVTAILSYTDKFITMLDDEIAVISKKSYQIFNKNDISIHLENKKIIEHSNLTINSIEKNGYKHFMLKEIYEQYSIIENLITSRINRTDFSINMKDLDISIKNIKRVIILACGTSYHAGLIGKFLIEDFLCIPCEVDIASEFRYRNHYGIINENCLVIAISQSGETADTIFSFSETKKMNAIPLVICNVENSALSKLSKNVIYTRCGPEIGVASTKAFTSQLCILYLLTLYLAKEKESIDLNFYNKVIDEIFSIPEKIKYTINSTMKVMESWAKIFFKKYSFLYLGRNINYPIALEGALKLKEISYIHAEGYPAGEMKHGPIALIDENMPVLTIATESNIYEKIASNVEEARARNGKMLVLANIGNENIKNIADYVCFVPKTLNILSPIINIIPLQLLAYEIAEIKGCDIDQPRNLAKSVTVE